MSFKQGCCVPPAHAPVARTTVSGMAGFTIVELLITLVMMAVALALAMPSLQQFSANNQIVAATNSIVSGLNYARFLAITTGDEITICPTENGVGCSPDNWHRGWIVFNDADGDSSADDSEILRVLNIEGAISSSGFRDAIVFESDGTTQMNTDAVLTNCFEQSGVTGKCIAITVRAFGTIESADASSDQGET